MSVSLPILHFNDVYRVQPQKLSSKSEETIDVTQFAANLVRVRSKWPERRDGERDGLVLFSGDLFSPSVESSVTRGSHMVPVINYLRPDVSLTGNHDFDFGYPHLQRLIEDCKFPWILSNIVDKATSKVPEGLREYAIVERIGLRIGVIGLVEKEWITTVSSWPPEFEYRDMAEVTTDLSKRLRNQDDEAMKCDLIIALTHCRVPNDVSLAKQIKALSPSAQENAPLANEHGADLVLGGHDHMYYISKGVNSWENYDFDKVLLGAEEDHGDVLIVKSGTDFRDLSEMVLDLEPTPEGSVRKKIIKSISGCRLQTQPGSESCEDLKVLLKKLLSSVSSALKAPVCRSTVQLDLRSQFIRISESAAGNWFADIIRHAYDDCLTVGGGGGADGVLICAGTLRGDSEYGPGVITLGDILEILPFDDPLVVLELDGQSIWDAIEAGLSTWPAQEGRFPVISGLRVSWDSRREPGSRVLGIWLVSENGTDTPKGDQSPKLEVVKRAKDGRKYKIVTRNYMAEGHDGFSALQGHRYLVDDEQGQTMSSIVRKYLLGSHFVNKLANQANENHPMYQDICQTTRNAIRREQDHRIRHGHETVSQLWKRAVSQVIIQARSKGHYRSNLGVAATEHMSVVDSFDGKGLRTSNEMQKGLDEPDDDLPVISPIIDGRFKDEGRS
ncbi:Metallo-dependent phosphatase [Dendrothele bispora CBS 962.96]|uniref:Metallo-dependent phosphatase n=1 Tax=Dendrothele bispora (strain CBS 962.96) TaxID=1314807 RepID=A0A4S8MXB5_DENBC|nr:Metallo-dependent phosphatase [Dendrothele bispora CBS 962.96]